MAKKKLLDVVGKTRNRIYRIGIELEGGWMTLPTGVEPIRDGSVVFMHPPERLCIGEVASEILEVPKFPAWMRTMYPSHVNDTCGLHVHMSFRKALHYERLMVPDYPKVIVAYIKRWAKDEHLDENHPIWKRLKNRNEFCKHDFNADQQVIKQNKVYDHNVEGSRYTVVNYCHGLHGTLECRILPMLKDVEQAIRGVQAVVDITNAFLLTTAKREEALIAEMIEADGVYRETRNEYL